MQEEGIGIPTDIGALMQSRNAYAASTQQLVPTDLDLACIRYVTNAKLMCVIYEKK